MRPMWLRWPSILAILFFALNVDLVLMPLAVTLGMPSGWPLFWFAAFFATAEPMYWNWFARWVVLNVRRNERVRRVTTAFREQQLGEQIREFLEEKLDWFVEHARIHADGGEANEQAREAALAIIKGTHILVTYPMMFLFGALPCGWPFGIFIHRIFPVPGGFVLFLAANAVKTYYLGLLYLWLPWWGRVLVFLCAVTFYLLSTRKIVRKVNVLTAS